MMGKITSNILILVKYRNHQRQFVQTERWRERGGPRETRGEGGDGGRGVADAPTLWSLGAMSTPRVCYTSFRMVRFSTEGS